MTLLGSKSDVLDPIGPGWLFASAVDFAGLDAVAARAAFLKDPTVPVTGLRTCGYTDGGVQISNNITSEDIDVDQEVTPVGAPITKVHTTLKTTLVQATVKNLALALGAGADVALPGGGSIWEPPSAGDITAVALWHLTDNGALWRFYSATPDGDVTVAAAKAPTKRTVPLGCKLTLGGPNNKPFGIYPNAAGQI
jgi:hypothetical protein